MPRQSRLFDSQSELVDIIHSQTWYSRHRGRRLLLLQRDRLHTFVITRSEGQPSFQALRKICGMRQIDHGLARCSVWRGHHGSEQVTGCRQTTLRPCRTGKPSRGVRSGGEGGGNGCGEGAGCRRRLSCRSTGASTAGGEPSSERGRAAYLVEDVRCCEGSCNV